MDALHAHRDYVARGRLSADLLREPVFRAWERSHLLHADPLRLKADHLDERDTERLLDRERWLIAASQPYMVALSRAAGNERHAAMLGDAEGFVLDVLGDEESVHGPTSVPGPGSLLTEAVAGANGIGTPLSEGGYVELVGPEHFIEGFHPFTCQGIPIHDPESRVIGSISTSVRRPEAGRRIREILLCAAHGIEAELLRGRLEEDVRRVLASGGMDEGLIEKLRQDVVQAQTGARLQVETAARGLSRNRFEGAMRILQLAERSIDSFRRQSALWHNLVSGETGASRPIGLDLIVRDLVELLATEAATGAIDLVVGDLEPATIEADPRAVARTLFGCFLRAFDAARGGGAVQVAVRKHAGLGAEVLLTPVPPMGSARPVGPVRLVLPLAGGVAQ